MSNGSFDKALLYLKFSIEVFLLTITRLFQFSSGHRLYRPDWTDTQNVAVFGPCSNPNGHGHNYQLEVSITGPISAETGMILNLRQLKECVTDSIIREVDHKNLNQDVAWMQEKIPTTEVFAEMIWQRLSAVLKDKAPEVQLEKIVLHETANNFVTRCRE